MARAKKIKPYSIKRAFIVSCLIFAFILTSIGWSNDRFTTQTVAIADGQNLVSVYYDGQNKTIATSAGTVKEALSKMGVTLAQGDVVEPALDKPITRGVTNINVYRAFSYVIQDGDKQVVTTSGYRSPKKVIEQAGLPIYPEDHVKTVRQDEFVTTGAVGQRLVIERSTPVTVVLAGRTFAFRTHAKTVGELFTEKKIEVLPQDVKNVSAETALSANMQIVVSRLAQRIVAEEQNVTPGTVRTVDSTKPIGYEALQSAGTPGKKVVSYLITEQDGVEQSRSVLEEKVLVSASPKVIIVGPSQTSTITGSDAWAKLRFCESGGNYSNKKNRLYRGAYQFDYATWNNYGGYYDPADAPPAVQDAKALDTYKRRGASPWPLCGRYLR